MTRLWLSERRWKVWKLFGIGFGYLFGYAWLMYVCIDIHTPFEQFRLAIALRGCAYAIPSATLMWSLSESIHQLEQFLMGLFIFNIVHMYLGGACGYCFHTTLFNHLFADDLARYGSYLTQTSVTLPLTELPSFLSLSFVPKMMCVALKQFYGIVVWLSGLAMCLFLLLDIPAIRTNLRKVPRWPVFAIEYLGRLRRG